MQVFCRDCIVITMADTDSNNTNQKILDAARRVLGMAEEIRMDFNEAVIGVDRERCADIAREASEAIARAKARARC